MNTALTLTLSSTKILFSTLLSAWYLQKNESSAPLNTSSLFESSDCRITRLHLTALPLHSSNPNHVASILAWVVSKSILTMALAVASAQEKAGAWWPEAGLGQPGKIKKLNNQNNQKTQDHPNNLEVRTNSTTKKNQETPQRKSHVVVCWKKKAACSKKRICKRKDKQVCDQVTKDK